MPRLGTTTRLAILLLLAGCGEGDPREDGVRANPRPEARGAAREPTVRAARGVSLELLGGGR